MPGLATIEGLPLISRQLTSFQARILGRAVTNTLMQAGTPILQAAKREVPQRHKALYKALRKRAWRNEAKARAGVIVSVSQSKREANPAKPMEGRSAPTPAFFMPKNYLHLVVYGTQPHRIGGGARAGRTVTKMVNGKMKSRKVKANATGGQHPGSRPNHFLTRAIASSKHAAANILENGLAASINKQIAKLKSRGRIK